MVSLVEAYEKEFKKNVLRLSSINNWEDFSSRKISKLSGNFETLLNENILVIVNENDTVQQMS